MKESKFFLRTKLLPPRAGTELLERPRLIERLQANLPNTLTMIAADAGCGKTTLISDFVRRQSRPSVWYQLDHTGFAGSSPVSAMRSFRIWPRRAKMCSAYPNGRPTC